MTVLSPDGSNSLNAPLANSSRGLLKSNTKFLSANAILTNGLKDQASPRAA